MLDTFTKCIKLYALKRATSQTILNRISKEYIPNIGKPDSILSDNGIQFTSKLWTNSMENLKIKGVYTTRYHPQSNPVERNNREIGRILRIYCHSQHSKWPDYLENVEYSMNRLRSEIIEIIPIQAFSGKRPTHLLDTIIEFPEKSEENKNEILCTIAERIKTKAQRREEKQHRNKKCI